MRELGLPVKYKRAYWSLRLCREAGEAGGGFVASLRRPRTYVAGTPALDPERSRAEAARRARGQLRRYCAANGLNRLGTLTYRGEGLHDPVQLRRDVAQFFRSLRASLDGEPFAYAWVPEWHKSGHGLHVHFAVGRYIPRSRIEQAWGRGFVHIKLLSNLPVGSGRWDEARLAARYLSKYVAKSFDEGAAIPGLHRYEVAQGFQPIFQRITGLSRDGVMRRAIDQVGSMPKQVWTSDSVPGWHGPPSLWVAW